MQVSGHTSVLGLRADETARKAAGCRLAGPLQLAVLGEINASAQPSRSERDIPSNLAPATRAALRELAAGGRRRVERGGLFASYPAGRSPAVERDERARVGR